MLVNKKRPFKERKALKSLYVRGDINSFYGDLFKTEVLKAFAPIFIGRNEM